MKRLFTTRILFVCLQLFLFGTQVHAAGFLKNWINTSGGSWFDPNNWSPNAVPTNGDAVTITNNGTYTVYAPTGQVTCSVFTIGGASGKQTFLYGLTAGFSKLFVTNSTIQANGILTVTNQGMYGSLLVQPGGELVFNAPGGLGMQIYGLFLTNQGTVTCVDSTVSGGDTIITNTGLWQITGMGGTGYGGVGVNSFYNAGTIRKLTSGGTATFGMDLINLPTGTVDIQSGMLVIAPNHTNAITGTYSVTSPGVVRFIGNEIDSDGTLSGTGTYQFQSGNFYARTNINPLIKLLGGEIYITGGTTFQQGGAITNLTLDGANLHGTNRIAGTLTVNSGNVEDYVTVLPGGQLLYTGYSQLYSTPLLMNLGTVVCSGSGLAFVGTPPTVISNGGTWTFAGDDSITTGGVGSGAFTNAGIVQKTGGTGTSALTGYPFVNLLSGVIRAASGTLQMPGGYTNIAGEVQLAGGTIAVGIFTSNGMTGGVLDGAGSILSPAAYDGGTVSPGPGAALIQFKSGLMLGTNVILSLDGTGTAPGASYDQLSVAGGATVISNATLQVTSLPSVPVGTTFVIITNSTINPTIGNFNGLPENAPLTISGQPFRIHYSGGDGNDVVLVRDSGTGTGPTLSNGGLVNKTFKVLGAGSVATIYTIQASTNLVQWTNVGMATGNISGSFIFTDTNAPNFQYRFYRTTN